jgi:hypothetical protein
MPSACSRPPGISTRYCCSGVTPKVYLISKSAGLPSGPSVLTKNRPSRRKKVEVTPAWLNFAFAKLPSTVASIASAIARSWCEPCQASRSFAWHEAHAAPPMNSAAAGAATLVTAGVPAGARENHHTAAAESASTASAAMAQIRRLAAGGALPIGDGAAAAVRAGEFLPDLRLRDTCWWA